MSFLRFIVGFPFVLIGGAFMLIGYFIIGENHSIAEV